MPAGSADAADAALDAATPSILIALGHVEGALVERGWVIESHPRARRQHDDAWVMAVLAPDGATHEIGIWLETDPERTVLTPAVELRTQAGGTLFRHSPAGPDGRPLRIDVRDTAALDVTLAAFRHGLEDAVGAELDRVEVG